MILSECKPYLHLRIISFAIVIFFLLAGCATKHDIHNLPAIDLTSQYSNAQAVIDVSGTSVITPPSPTVTPSAPVAKSLSLLNDTVLTEWWRLFENQELNDLMDRALANNPDLRIALLRIAQSQARLDQAGASKTPTITMPVQVKNEYPEFGPGRGNTNGNNKSRITHQISLKGDWRPDIWGEADSLYKSAELQLLRATYQRDDMQRNIAANVAISYLEYLSLNDRLRVAHETEISLEQMLASVDARMQLGDATITQKEQQKAALYAVKSTIPVLKKQREIILSRLAALVDSGQVALKLSDSGLNSMKIPPVLPGAPSALLLRRPDVRAVEAQLLAADADINIARARILPSLDMTAQIGYGSMHLSKLFNPQALFWSTIANLSVVIFDSGKRSKEVEFTQAVHEELLEAYIRAIYNAVREVDESLSEINFASERLESQGVAADSSLLAWNFSQKSFMVGVSDYMVVLDTQRIYQRNLDDWYIARFDRYRSLINLFSALGGGIPGHDPTLVQGAMLAPVKTDSQKASIEVGNVDWAGNSLHGSPWLVEISGLHDRGAVLPAWRSLHTRFPHLIENKTLLPQRQGQVVSASKERSSWYRLFIATFSDKKIAEGFCAALRAGQQRCDVMSSQSLEGKGGFVLPLIDGKVSNKNTEEEPVGKMAGLDKNISNHQSGNQADMVQVKEEQQNPVEAKESLDEQVLVENQAAKITQPLKDEVEESLAISPETLVDRWMKDWSSKKVDNYLSHYDIEFKPKNEKDRETWEAKRRHRINEAGPIKVSANKLKIKWQGKLMATARFVETVEVGNYKKVSQKELLLIRRDGSGEWKIREELELDR